MTERLCLGCDENGKSLFDSTSLEASVQHGLTIRVV